MKSEPKRNNLIKNLLNIMIAASFILGLINFFIKEDYLGTATYVLIVPVLLLSPRILYNRIWHTFYKISLVNMLEFFAILIFTSASLGTWGLYQAWFEYDTFAHFFILLLIAVVLAFLINFYNGEPSHYNILNLSIVVFSLTLFLGLFWEVFEFSADKLFNTMLFFGFKQTIFADTMTDIIADIFGAFAGSLIVYFKWPKWQKEWRHRGGTRNI